MEVTMKARQNLEKEIHVLPKNLKKKLTKALRMSTNFKDTFLLENIMICTESIEDHTD